MSSQTTNDGDDGSRILGRAAALADAGRREEALATLVAQSPTPPFELAAELLTAQLLASSDTERCWAIYTDALARYPTHALLHLRAGVFAYERGDWEQARALLERSWYLALLPEAGFYLGRLCDESGEPERAVAYFAQVAVFEGESGHWRTAAAAALRRLL